MILSHDWMEYLEVYRGFRILFYFILFYFLMGKLGKLTGENLYRNKSGVVLWLVGLGKDFFIQLSPIQSK